MSATEGNARKVETEAIHATLAPASTIVAAMALPLMDLAHLATTAKARAMVVEAVLLAGAPVMGSHS